LSLLNCACGGYKCIYCSAVWVSIVWWTNRVDGKGCGSFDTFGDYWLPNAELVRKVANGGFFIVLVKFFVVWSKE
jgi:hypothetical protein